MAVLIMTSVSVQSFALDEISSNDLTHATPHSRVVSVGFNLKNSLAGPGYNVITSNIFDCVPSYGGAQKWQNGTLRYLKVKPGTTVTVAGSFYYRTFFGNTRLKEFSREAYVPFNTKLVVVE